MTKDSIKNQIVSIRKPKTTLPVMNSIKERFSPRVFSQTGIPKSDIELMFEAARLSPSARNHQPWKFFTIKKDSEAYFTLLDCIPERNLWCTTASLFIVCSYDPSEPKDGTNKWCLYDLGAACLSLVLQAQELGYYSRQIGSFDIEKAKSALKIQDPYNPFVLIAMGKLGNEEDYKKATDEIIEKEKQPWERKKDVYVNMD